MPVTSSRLFDPVPFDDVVFDTSLHVIVTITETRQVFDEAVFDINYTCAIVGEEKLVIGFLVNQSTAGATTAPSRIEYVAKFVPAVDAPITRVDIINTGTTNEYSISSNLTALGTD